MSTKLYFTVMALSLRGIVYPLAGTKTYIGRGVEFGVESKRVSRRHCQLDYDIAGKSGVLTTLGPNPCYVKTASGDTDTLRTGRSITLHFGDSFALLSDDFTFLFVAADYSPGSTLPTIDETVPLDTLSTLPLNSASPPEVPLDTLPVETVAATSISTASVIAEAEALPDLPADDLPLPPPVKRVLPAWMQQTSSQNADSPTTSADSEELGPAQGPRKPAIGKRHAPPKNRSIVTKAKQPKVTLSSEAAVSQHHESLATPEPPVTPEPEDEDSRTPSFDRMMTALQPEDDRSLDGLDPVAVHATFGAAVGESSQPPPQVSSARVSCEYGPRCYRKNPGHLSTFAHPGDRDYSSGIAAQSSAPASADPALPLCPYGSACYRKNPQHFLETRHSRTAAETANAALRNTASDDDEDDSFIDDNDEYTPSDDDDEEVPYFSGADDDE